jgi:hypothetical protein
MKIETEFKPGDTVYVILDKKIERGVVRKLRVVATEDEYGLSEAVTIIIDTEMLQCEMPQDRVGATPAKLANKLVREFNIRANENEKKKRNE